MNSQVKKAIVKKTIAAFGGAAALTVLAGCGAGNPATGAHAPTTIAPPSSTAPAHPQHNNNPRAVPEVGCIVGANC